METRKEQWLASIKAILEQPIVEAMLETMVTTSTTKAALAAVKRVFTPMLVL